MKDLYGWEALLDGPLSLATFCRSEGYDPSPANMTALAESIWYEDFRRKYPPQPRVSHGKLGLLNFGKKQGSGEILKVGNARKKGSGCATAGKNQKKS